MQASMVIGRRRFVGARRFLRVMAGRKVALLGAIVSLLFIAIAIFAPLLAPHDPIKINLARVLEPPSREFLLGTDQLGRDVLSRILYGARISLQVGLIAVLLAGIVGMTLGLIAGYFSGWPNMIIMRFIDALMAIPGILLMIAIAGVLGGGLRNLMIALGISIIPAYCRLMCGLVLAAKRNDYVMASRVLGAGNVRILFGHIFPNCLPQLIVLVMMNLGMIILAEAGLSFLGLGIQPPTPSWGVMVSDGYRYLLSNPTIALVPGFCVMVVVWSFNMAGDGLRDALDPRLRGTV